MLPLPVIYRNVTVTLHFKDITIASVNLRYLRSLRSLYACLSVLYLCDIASLTVSVTGTGKLIRKDSESQSHKSEQR
jgi:hypothetical protein